MHRTHFEASATPKIVSDMEQHEVNHLIYNILMKVVLKEKQRKYFKNIVLEIVIRLIKCVYIYKYIKATKY